jgi:hypothetical protein
MRTPVRANPPYKWLNLSKSSATEGDRRHFALSDLVEAPSMANVDGTSVFIVPQLFTSATSDGNPKESASEHDIDYFRVRERQERLAAKQARSASIRARHQELAMAYAALVRGK